jgi:PAS domain S-box-containing protein
MLGDMQLPSQWSATIVDRQNIVVARSERHDTSTGTKLRNEFLSIASPSGGVLKGVDRDGIAVSWTYRRAETTGWYISVSTPESLLNAPLKRAMVIYGIVGGLLVIVAFALSYQIGDRLSQSIGVLGIDRKPTRQEFELLFESAPNGVLVVDNKGLIVLLNACIEMKFGYVRDELIGQSVEVLIPERFRKGHLGLRNAFTGAPKPRPMGAGQDLYGQRKDGSEFPIEIGLNPIRTKAGSLVMATVVDITARKNAEDRLSTASVALRTSEDHRRLAVEAAEFGMWTWNLITDEVWWSDRLREIIGVSETMIAHHTSYIERVDPSDRHIPEGNKNRAFSGQRGYDQEYRIVRMNDHSTRWVNSKGRIDRDETGKPTRMYGVIQDITARKEAERERDNLRRRVMRAHEDERLRLAHELHDQTGQSLAAALLELKRIETFVDKSRRDHVRLLRNQLELIGKTLHHVAWELRPASIDELGLASSLSNYLSGWGMQFGVEVDFHCRDSKLEEVPDEVRTTIYRIVQEALTNISKHAPTTTSVSIVIDRLDATLRLTIEDNGDGIGLALPSGSESKRGGGLGLVGIRERLSLIGGELEIESSAGDGTTIFVRIPLERERMTA